MQEIADVVSILPVLQAAAQQAFSAATIALPFILCDLYVHLYTSVAVLALLDRDSGGTWSESLGVSNFNGTLCDTKIPCLPPLAFYSTP